MREKWTKRLVGLTLLVLLVFLVLMAYAVQAAQFADNLIIITSGDAIAQNQYSGSVAVPGISGRDADLFNVILTTSGSPVPVPAGTVLIFQADPDPTASDVSILLTEREDIECQMAVAVADWQSDANGASAQLTAKPCRFREGLSQLFVVWFHQDAVAFATHGMKVSLRWAE